MNINTNTLLNTLLSKGDGTLKAKIEKLAVDGKVDLSSIVKDKGIQTLLTGLFKDISMGTKNKTEVMSLLENSKNSLKFKNISTDLKQILNAITTELKNTPQLEKLTALLKTSLLDIKNMDEKLLKTTFQNSGVFLESKLAKSNESVSQNMKNLSSLLGDKIKILESINKTLSSNFTDTKTQKMPTITNELKSDLKLDVQSILKKLEIASTPNTKVEVQLNSLKTALLETTKLEQKMIKTDVKNEITTNLKEAVQQIKNNILNNVTQGINKTITIIKNQLENIKPENILEVKTEVKKLDLKIEILNNEKNIDSKIVIVKDLIEQSTKLNNKIGNSNIQELLKNNIGMLKNISSDLKTVMLQIKETIEHQSSSENVSKELKNNVEKVLSQIDFYQLSSYSSNSNHSYLSFLQDDLEDVDIKFNNGDNEEFSCLIHLTLKEKGGLKIILQIDKKKGLNINIGVEQQEFKQTIQSALQKLRVQINSLGLSVLSLNIFDLDIDDKKTNELKAYGNNQSLDFGLDIKV